MKSIIKSASLLLIISASFITQAHALEYERPGSIEAQRQAEAVSKQLDGIGFVDMNNPSQAYLSSPYTVTPSYDLQPVQVKPQPETKKDPLRHDF